MSSKHVWPEIEFKDDEKDPDYVPAENVRLLLDLTQEKLKSQLDGVRQMFSRSGSILTQASTLASASAGAVFWLLTHNLADGPRWIIWTLVIATTIWATSAGFAALAMAGAMFAAPGMHPRDGYRQDVLGQSVPRMQLWLIESLAGTLDKGHVASDRLRNNLNIAILFLVAAPVVAALAAVGGLFL